MRLPQLKARFSRITLTPGSRIMVRDIRGHGIKQRKRVLDCLRRPSGGAGPQAIHHLQGLPGLESDLLAPLHVVLPRQHLHPQLLDKGIVPILAT